MLSNTLTSDQELLRSFSQGNNDAIAVILNRYQKKMFTSIVLLVKDRAIAEDIFQDTFIKIIDQIKSGHYNEEGKFLPWASRIARNLCIDHFRRQNKMNTQSQTPDGKDIFLTIDLLEENAEDQLIRRQSHENLRTLIQKLPFEQKEVLIMRHYNDMSFKEIAQTTNVSINTALGRMRYALQNLRRMMEHQTDEMPNTMS